MFGRKSLVVAVAVATFSLAGCAGHTTSSPANEPRAAPSEAEIYRWRVERAARMQGTQVVWVNPPEDRDRVRQKRRMDSQTNIDGDG